ncbi:MAG: cell wall hydrolase [Fusobacterium sp.]|nr:cell wall hydrolase [Fusobacterium sp.]
MQFFLKKNKRIIVIFITLILSISCIYAAAKKASSVSTKNPSNADSVKLLARLINGEARGEPYLGQVAVGAVVMNRVKDSKFPNTISGVIYQKGQFSCVKDGNFDKPIKEGSTVYKAAEEALNGADPSNGALYFYNPKTAKSDWLFTRPTVKTIGNHRFAK